MDEGRQTCTGCGQQQPVGAFGWKDRAAGRRHTRCADCRRAYQQQWYAANAEAHRARAVMARRERHASNRKIVDVAKAQPCADCGRRCAIEQMDFDHVRGTKDGNIARLVWSVSADRLRAEIDKCDVVCAVCHRVRTTSRRMS